MPAAEPAPTAARPAIPTESAEPSVEAGHPRLWRLLFAMSLAQLLTVSMWNELMHLPAPAHYHLPDFGRSMYLSALLLAALLTALVYALASLHGRTRSARLRTVLGLLLLAALLLPAEFFIRYGVGVELERWVVEFPWLAGIVGVAGALAGGYLLLFRLPLLVRAVSVVVLLIAPLALLDYGRAALAAVTTPFQHELPAASIERKPAAQRVVWMIFDEFDQRLGFDARPARIDLKEFDALRAISVVSNEAYPPGPKTLISVPGLVGGTTYKDTDPVDRDTLLTWTADGEEKVPWSERPSVFRDAIGRGHSVHIAGFDHPYCRVLARQWTGCRSWSWRTVHYTSDMDLLDALVVQAWSITPLYRVRRSLAVHDEMRPYLRGVAADRDVDLAFLHATVPHEPFLYDATTGTYTWTLPRLRFGPDGYIDNLAAADLYFGSLRDGMEQAGVWDGSVVIATSDHHWRRSRQYDGVLDKRVPLMIKMPGQTTGRVVPGRLETKVLRELILELLDGRIRTPDQLADWLQARTTAP
jgi:hypothetical protein